jgi:hypothetical protein
VCVCVTAWDGGGWRPTLVRRQRPKFERPRRPKFERPRVFSLVLPMSHLISPSLVFPTPLPHLVLPYAQAWLTSRPTLSYLTPHLVEPTPTSSFLTPYPVLPLPHRADPMLNLVLPHARPGLTSRPRFHDLTTNLVLPHARLC